MNSNTVFDLIEKWKNDSKLISKEAETELINIIVYTLITINKIRGVFGRSYDPLYPKLSEKGLDDQCFYIIHINQSCIEIADIDDDYIYLYYMSGRKLTKERLKIPIDMLVNFSDKINIEMYKQGVINAEKIYKENKIRNLKRAVQDAENDYKYFCEKYFQNN